MRAYVGVARETMLPPSSGRSTSRAPIRLRSSTIHFSAPAVRSLVGEDFHYHRQAAPTSAVWTRGSPPTQSSGSTSSWNEPWRPILMHSLFNRIALAAFTDLAHTGSAVRMQPLTGDRIRFLADAGLGLRAEHRIGDTRFTTRFDVPLICQPARAGPRPESGRRESWSFAGPSASSRRSEKAGRTGKRERVRRDKRAS